MSIAVLALFTELIALAFFAVAILYGRFDQGPLFFGVLLTALALITYLLKRLAGDATGRLVAHGALMAGCVLFSFPFVWLVSSSFKYNEELFVYPPKWVPSIPPGVVQSPYITATSLPPLARPDTIDAARWQALWPKLQEMLWNQSSELLPPAAALLSQDAPTYPVLTQGIFTLASRAIPRYIWPENDLVIINALAARLDSALMRDVWESVFRSVALRPLTVKDITHNDYVLGDATLLQNWRSQTPNLQLSIPGTLTDDTRPLYLRYQFSHTNPVTLTAEFPLPVTPERFLGFTLPMRQDRSWHRWRVSLEIDGRRYVNPDPLYLGQHRWQEIGFKLQHRHARDERDLGIWPLVAATDQTDAYAEPGKFHLTLSIERASRLQALWRKYANNYRSAYIATEHRWNYIFNSVYLTILSIIGQVLSCSLVAYAFSRLRWPGRDLLFGVLLATMMLPPQVTMIPVFMVFRALGWYNTLKALWVPSFFGSAFFIFMLRQFMKGIPNDLEDAAKIDGCSIFGIYWRIILPLVKPALAAVCIFTFMGVWNDFMGPLIYINDQRLYPLALGLFDFRAEHGSEFGMLMAASTLMALPVVAIFFAAQRYFIQGVTLTGMKG
jgi:ABC-type glycerol-3-phosphate transport system permease component